MGDRLSRVWLAVLTLFVVLQAPLMSHKLAMACAAAADALLGSRQSRIEINALRAQLQNAQRRGEILQVDYEPTYGPR